MKTTSRTIVRIDQWSMVISGDGYTAPELIRYRLYGKVYGHPRHEEGKYIATSTIVGCEGDRVLTYAGTLYALGDPDPEYERTFPRAKERLLKRMREVAALPSVTEPTEEKR